LLAQLLQLTIQAQDFMIFGHLNLEFAFNFDFGEMHSISFYEASNNNRYVLELMVNALILRSYNIFSIYELLLSQKLGDWVKAQFTT
jgi:hypothetical protein